MGAGLGFVPTFDGTAADAALAAMCARAWREFAPPPKLSIGEWAERYREMSPEESAMPGRFSLEFTPALRSVLDSCSDPNVRKVVVQKSPQLGYTAGVVCNVMGYHVHHRPSVQVAVFPRLGSAKDFAAEKLDPMIRATPVLASRVALKSRAAGNSQTRKHYSAGLIKLVGSNSPADVKSTSARVVIVEEPDDANTNVKGQGNSIKLAEERAKTIPDHLILIGGTATAKGASNIEAEMATTDKRVCLVACHACGDEHTPAWEHVTIPDDPQGRVREVYGMKRWEDAYYTCPHCGTVWTEEERIANITHRHRFQPTADSPVHGYYLNELLSVFDGSRVPILARKFLEAQHAMDAGDPTDMIAFWNSSLGLPWEYRGELPEEDELRERADDYAEWSAPAGGLVPLLTVDVQHDRLAVTCWVVGRGEEMWLAYWGELYGQTVVPMAGAWLELDQVLDKRLRHVSGRAVPIKAVAIDCSDGQTSDAVYTYVRQRNRPDRPVLAVKGAADAEGREEIWKPPTRRVDPNGRATKAARFGVVVHIVGTAKAKDLILGWAQEGGRVRLVGPGPGRMHWYQGVRADFYEQLLGEIKVPMRLNPKRRQWKPRTDRRNEALDCTVYAVYLVRHLGLNLKKPHWWDAEEARLLQHDLFEAGEASETPGEAKGTRGSTPMASPLPDARRDRRPTTPAVADDDVFAPIPMSEW